MTTNYERAEYILDNTFELDQTQELAAAQARATLAVADAIEKLGPWIKEIGDQLDSVPRHSVVPRIQLTAALQLVQHESKVSRDVDTRKRLNAALVVLMKLIDGQPEMASTGTIDDAEHTS